MTTAIRESRGDDLLREALVRDGLNSSDGNIAFRKENIEAFVNNEWKDMKRHIRLDFLWELLVEPLWVDVGHAMFFQKQVIHQRIPRLETPENGGSPVVTKIQVKDNELDWKITGPFPCGTASQVAKYLEKGLLLRHPSEGKSVEKLETAESAGAVRDKTPAKHPYACIHGNDRYSQPSWKAYIRHCQKYGHSIGSYAPPEEVKERAARYKWFCILHNIGFESKNKRGATHHLRKPHYRSYNAQRMTLEDLGVDMRKKAWQGQPKQAL